MNTKKSKTGTRLSGIQGKSVQSKRYTKEHLDEKLDEALDETFPASDPVQLSATDDQV